MDPSTIELRNMHDPSLEALLDDRLYEFNSHSTGLFDGELFSGCVNDEAGNVIAAISGHTWGGCCEVKRLWVDEFRRGRGLGRALMLAAEAEARKRGCSQVLLSTHSFQAPEFYERLGYRKQATIPDYPRGHAKLYYGKQLAAAQAPDVNPTRVSTEP